MEKLKKELHKITDWEKAAERTAGIELDQLNLRKGYVTSASATISEKGVKTFVTYDSTGRCFCRFMRMNKYDINLSQEYNDQHER